MRNIEDGQGSIYIGNFDRPRCLLGCADIFAVVCDEVVCVVSGAESCRMWHSEWTAENFDII